MKHINVLRGAVLVRADANAAQIFADLNTSFNQFQAAIDERLKAVESGKPDPLLTEKVDKASADVMDLQAQLNAAVMKIESSKLDITGRKVRDAEYNAEFDAHIRKGVESERIAAVNAQLSQGTASEGGAVAPVEWDRTLTDKLKIVGGFRALAKVQTISSAGFSKDFNSKGTASGWVGETAGRPATANSSLGSLTYRPYELYANVSATQTILDDAEINIEDWITSEVEEEFSYQENLAFISGSGVSRPTGILTYVTGAANAGLHPFGDIKLVNSLVAAGLSWDGIQNLITALPTKFTPNASFIMNRNVMGEVAKLKDTTNQPLWQPSLQIGLPATIRGYAVNEISDMPDLAANSTSIGFGDWQKAYLIVDRMGIRILRDPYTNKPFVQFYVTKRVGGGLLNPESCKFQKTSL